MNWTFGSTSIAPFHVRGSLAAVWIGSDITAFDLFSCHHIYAYVASIMPTLYTRQITPSHNQMCKTIRHKTLLNPYKRLYNRCLICKDLRRQNSRQSYTNSSCSRAVHSISVTKADRDIHLSPSACAARAPAQISSKHIPESLLHSDSVSCCSQSYSPLSFGHLTNHFSLIRSFWAWYRNNL